MAKRVINRESISISAVIVSQRTAPLVLGFRSERAYLDWISTAPIRSWRRGMDVLCRVDDAIRVLCPEDLVPPVPPTADAECDRVLAAIGRSRSL